MKITGLSAQQKNSNRINVLVDGRYRFSFDVFQLSDLRIRVGQEYTEQELQALETESQFGKVYARALEYCLARPHSAKEVRDYLYRKTLDTRMKTGGVKKGVTKEVTERVFDTLVEKGYINDENFARFWLENRRLKKGASQRLLTAELRAKGIEQGIIDALLAESPRTDDDELKKVIAKKRARYPDQQKLIQYLVRQGFLYDDIKAALAEDKDAVY